MKYHSYQHIERYNREEYKSFADARDIYVFPKIDGTAGVVTCEDGEIIPGSRNRQICVGKDNQGFAAWVASEDPEACAIREFCAENEKLHIHGEWLGEKKLVGSIKDYTAKGFWIYDVYDEDNGYMDYDHYVPLLEGYGIRNIITPMAVLDAFDEEKIYWLAKQNHFLLPENKVGEGVVLKSYNWRDQFGNQQFFKLVLEEFKENKGKGKPKFDPGEIEVAIIQDFVTAADIEKAYNKCKLAVGDNAPFHKVIGMTMNEVMDDFLREEMTEVVRKYRFPKIDFSVIKALINDKVRVQIVK